MHLILLTINEMFLLFNSILQECKKYDAVAYLNSE